MHNPAYLMRSRHSIYYFRWPIPKAIRPSRTSHVVLSLGTREPHQALHLARVLEYHASLIVRRYGAILMNSSDAKAIVQEYCQQVLGERKRHIRENGPLSAEQLAVYRQRIEDAETAKALGPSVAPDDSQSMSSLLATMNLSYPESSEEYEKIRANYRAALPAFAREVLRFNDEQENFNFAPAQQSMAEYSEKSATRYTLEEVAKKFIDMQMLDGRWDHNTHHEKLAHIETIKEIVGSSFIVNDMNAEKARHVRDTIRQLPKNRSKNPKLRNLSLMQSLDVQGVPKIAPATIKKYIETYNALFSWCVDEGYTEKNNFHALRGRGDQQKGKLKRRPFSDNEIKVLLAEVDKGRDGLANKDYRYWGTLIGIFTGARLNEVAQIMLDDIKQEDGVWYFDMNDDGDFKKLKTDASRRRVPIHNALLNRGIIEYRDRLRKEGKSRLLHELTHCKKNGWGKNLGHFCNQVLLPKLGMKEPGLVYHCFRHTVNTRLRHAGVELTVVQTILGHSRSGGASEIYFNEGHTLSSLKAALDQLHSF